MRRGSSHRQEDRAKVEEGVGGAGSLTRLRMDTPSCLSHFRQLQASLGLWPHPSHLCLVSTWPPSPFSSQDGCCWVRWHPQSRMISSPGLNLLHLQRQPPGQACSRVPGVSRWTCLQGPPFPCTGLGDLRGTGGCGCPCCWSVQENETGRPGQAIRTLRVGDGLRDASVAD